MKRATPNAKHTTVWRWAVTVGLLLALVYLAVRNHAVFTQAASVLAHASPAWSLIAVLASGCTYLIAAAIYTTLALKGISYARTVVVEGAASFANRLLPAGLGGLGLHGLYLHRQKHSAAEATAIVSVNNLLGMVAHLTILTVVCAFQPHLIGTFTSHWAHVPWRAIVVAVVCVVLLALATRRVRSTVRRFLSELATSLRHINKKRVARAYCLALLLTATYTLALFASGLAVGLHLGVLQVFIIFSIGMLAGTATPTPGGLVGIEAGLYGGFIGYGVHSASAAAAVLLYRLATYWLPLLPGFICLAVARSRKYV